MERRNGIPTVLCVCVLKSYLSIKQYLAMEHSLCLDVVLLLEISIALEHPLYAEEPCTFSQYMTYRLCIHVATPMYIKNDVYEEEMMFEMANIFC